MPQTIRFFLPLLAVLCTFSASALALRPVLEEADIENQVGTLHEPRIKKIILILDLLLHNDPSRADTELDWKKMGLRGKGSRVLRATTIQQLQEKLQTILKYDEEISHLLIESHGNNGYITVGDMPYDFQDQKVDDPVFSGICGRLSDGAKVVFRACHLFEGDDATVKMTAQNIRDRLGIHSGFVFGFKDKGFVPARAGRGDYVVDTAPWRFPNLINDKNRKLIILSFILLMADRTFKQDWNISYYCILEATIALAVMQDLYNFISGDAKKHDGYLIQFENDRTYIKPENWDKAIHYLRNNN